jgi:hypothetical protein
VLLAVESVEPVFRLPAWDPSIAASAGAGFAGVLGALLLATTFQIAIAKRGEHEHGLNSLAVAPISLLLLLVAAYLYVVLSGTTRVAETQIDPGNGASISLIDACQSTASLEGCSALAVPAGMFAIAGSYLGLGAISLGFVLRLLVDEHENAKVGRGATLVFFWAGSVVAIAALIWGYRDAFSVFERRNVSIPAYLSERSTWLPVILAMLAGIVIASLGWSKRRNPRIRWAAALGLIAYLSAPVLWYLRIQGTNVYAPELPLGAAHLTGLMLAWVLLAYVVCIAILFFEWWSRSRKPGPPWDDASLPSAESAKNGHAVADRQDGRGAAVAPEVVPELTSPRRGESVGGGEVDSVGGAWMTRNAGDRRWHWLLGVTAILLMLSRRGRSVAED